jgi:hypothetical protein
VTSLSSLHLFSKVLTHAEESILGLASRLLALLRSAKLIVSKRIEHVGKQLIEE